MAKMRKQPLTRFGSITEEFPPPSRPAPVLSPQLDLSLNREPQALVDIVKNSKDLPRVVKCDPSTMRSMRLPFNISQPLLLHSRRSVIKVGARSVHFNKEKGRFQDTGDDILVPEDYPGWFGVLGCPKHIKSDASIPYYRNVGKLGITGCRQFLVGGTACINGFTRVAGDQRWECYMISPGEVLRKIGMYQERKEPSRSSVFRRQRTPIINRYLRCYDTNDREILLPATQDGVFYILTQDGPSSRTPVLTISHILQRYRNKFPIVVKLLYGPVPRVKCAFKDTLQLEESELSHTVIASTMENLRNINLEIPLDSDIRFFTAVHTTALTTSRQYQQARADCEAKAPTYKRNMKVIVGFGPEEDLPLPQPPPDSPSTDCATPLSGGDERQIVAGHSENSAATSPMSVRRDRSFGDNTPRRSSRLSVISRVITLNAEEQNVFVSKIPPSPDTPTSPKVKQLSLKQTRKNLMPGAIALMEEFTPPQEPETIPAVSNKTPISDLGREKREKFMRLKQKEHEYEQPSSVCISNEEPEDSDTYGTLWSSSTMNRASGAGIRIDSKPGKPTNTQTDFDPPPLDLNGLTLDHVPFGMISPSDLPSPQIVDLREQPHANHPFRISPSPSNASSLSLSSNQSNPEVWNFQKDQVSVPDNQPQYENTIPPSPDRDLSTSTSDLFSKQPYNSPHVEAASYQHIYNDLIEDTNSRTQGLKSPLPLPTPHPMADLDASSPSYVSDGVNGDYITPLDTDYYATPKDLPVSFNQYEKPGDVWQETRQLGNGLALFELKNVVHGSWARRENNRDSGVEADDIAESTVEDPYDYPTSSARQSMATAPDYQAIYDTPKTESSMLDALQRRLQERNERIKATSPAFSGETSFPAVRPFHLNINPPPPPLPSNHPVGRLTPNKTVFNIINNIHNVTPTTPEMFSKDVLIEELKKSGLKSTSELAFQALQVADVTMLAQKQDDLDDVLVTLLPNVGTVDLRKIAMCIKNLCTRVSNR